MNKQLIEDIFQGSADAFANFGLPVEPYSESGGKEPHYYINDDGVDIDSPDQLPDGRYKVTHETVKRGLKRCLDAKVEGDKTTIKYLPPTMLREIISTAITGEMGSEWDACYDTAVVEIGLWGRVVYG